MTSRPRSTLGDLNDIEEYLESAGFQKGDVLACRKYLAMVGEHLVRRPGPVARAAQVVLADPKKHKLGKREQYGAMELLAYASLDVGDDGTAEAIVETLQVSFPDSDKVGRLRGCVLEQRNKFPEALALYDAILEKHPAEQRVWKRKVGCYKAVGDFDAAIKTLTEYLDVFMGDASAWEELAGLYCEKNHFAQSIFCWEEVICAQPQLAKHHRHIAEVYYTAGGVDNLTTARKYYAAALDMSTASDLRAMYGLVLVDKKLKDFEQKKNGIGNGKKSLGDASNVAQGDVGADLGKDAAAFIPKIYKVACPGLLPVVQKQLAMAV